MLWDSKDLGDHWTKVSDFHGLSARPFYFSLLHVSPVDDRRLFFSSYLLLRSDDGGKTTTPIDRGVHVDHHALWIAPQNPDRMIQGNDGGAYVTENAAKSWRFLNNLPIGQFYMVAADNNNPYMLCGGLQDNNAWCGPSSNVGGGGGGGGGGGLGGAGVNGSEWFTVTGGGGEYAVPAPNDKSKQVTSGGSINYDISGAETYNTILTVTLAPTDSNVIWVGTDDGLVHVTRDGGKTWTNVSGHFPGLAKEVEGRVYQIGISPFDASAAYVAIDRHELHDRRPYGYKTGDYGKTWVDIGKGLPQDVPARVVRAGPDPRRF